ncbi:MAG: LTA synthase family protein [Lachnospiraceae bacterium]
MKRIHIKKIDFKGLIYKIKNLKKEDIKEHWKQKKERRDAILEKHRNSEFAKKLQPIYRMTNRFSLVFHLLVACILNFFIEAISRLSFVRAWSYMTETPVVFLYNAFLIFITFSLVYLVRRRTFVRILISVFWLVLGVCNGYMLTKRVTPFNAQDLKVAGDAVSLINSYFNAFELILLVIGIVAVVIWVVSIWRRGGQYAGKMHRIIALGGVVFWFGAFSVVTNLAVDKRVVSTYFGNIAFAYEDYGFPYCFSASIFNTGISEPHGYSKETIDKIGHDGAITETVSDIEQLPNIMFVQLESFFDPTEVEYLQMSSDPIPNFRRLSKEFSSGYFKVPSVGAGTANTEMEVLTGMNLRYFGPGEYPYKTVLKENTAESAATALGKLGYGTHALHNNGGNFYSRSTVFDNMGFDSFTSKEFMNVLQLTENGWAKDDILIQHMMEAMDTTTQQDFVFGVSVQGHGNYPEEKVIVNPEITVAGVEDEGRRNAWEYYVNQVYEMDQFVQNLITAVQNRKEPAVIVFYGDHLPTMGLEAKDLTNRYLYNTNYVIWDNIDLEKQDRNIPSYQIMADVLDKVGIHSGTIFNYHQQRRKTKNYLQDLELLQYDILYGKQYIYEKNGKPITKGHMQMGIKDVTLTGIAQHLDDTYSLYGTNFTKASKAYINGEKQKVTFLNNTRIDLPESKLHENDIVTVSQVGSSNTIFRTSKEYRYQGSQLVDASIVPEPTEEVSVGPLELPQ